MGRAYGYRLTLEYSTSSDFTEMSAAAGGGRNFCPQTWFCVERLGRRLGRSVGAWGTGSSHVTDIKWERKGGISFGR